MNNLLSIGLLLLVFTAPAQAQEDQWSDEWDMSWEEELASPWSQSGFVELALGERISAESLFNDQSTLSDVRWHQAFDYAADEYDFNFDFDLWFDDIEHSLVFDLRELNFKFSLFGQTDVVLGRQITTWGTGDLLFINDMFPKDWQSFFSGRDDNYLKAPADSLRLTSYFAAFNVDLVLTPQVEPDRFINGQRFALFSPWAGMPIGGTEVINPRNVHNSEYALRLFKNINGKQLALYGYRGYEKSPNGIDDTSQAYFPRKNVYGMSLQSNLGQGLYNIELGYHQALDDSAGLNPRVPNSQWRLLLGYERELVKKLNWGVQYYLEHTTNYQNLVATSPHPQYLVDQNRQVITNRLTYRAMQDKLTWSMFVFYSPTDEDSYWRPSVNYRHNDQWQFSLGGNVFTGKEHHTFFGQFEDASNIYSRIRFQF